MLNLRVLKCQNGKYLEMELDFPAEVITFIALCVIFYNIPEFI